MDENEEIDELLEEEDAKWEAEQKYLSLGDLLFNQPEEAQ